MRERSLRRLHSYRQDSLGPFGKSAWDVAALLEPMVPGSPSYCQYTTSPFADISRYKLGVPRRGFAHTKAQENPPTPADEATAHAAEVSFEAALRIMGAGIKANPADIKDVEKLWAAAGKHEWDDTGRWQGTAEELSLNTEVYSCLNDYLATLDGFHLKTIEDLVEWNNAHPVRWVPDGSPQDCG